jgi:16S rRNA (guanine966-N2)-methyltransferase
VIRISGGKHKRKYINTPHNFNTRPTSSRLRESIFNILLHSKNLPINFIDMEVIDIFAGSGALGIESLSRGCKYCTFIDSSQEAIETIKKNIQMLQEEKNTNIIQSNAMEPINSKNKYDLCFFDPPYDIQNFSTILEKWIESKLMKENTLYVYEKHKNSPLKLEKNIEIIEKKKTRN